MISVVIPAYNEEKFIGRSLASLASQKGLQEKFEVIVVDNNSTDKTVGEVLKFKNKLNLRIVKEKVKGRGFARRRGFASARGRLILSTDADTVVPSDWIKNTVGYLDREDIAAVTGPAIIDDCSRSTNFIFNLINPSAMFLYKAAFGHCWVYGFNFGVRKELYKKIGGFNPKMDLYEDVDLGKRLNSVGRVKYVRSLTVKFSGRRFKKGFVYGAFPYIKGYVTCFFLKTETVVLDDVR